MKLENFMTRLTLIFLLYLRKATKADYTAYLPSSGCPQDYSRINNGCYKFVNDSVSFQTANQSCYTTYSITRETMLQNSQYYGTITHLIAFESLAETIAMFFWLKGFQYQSSFYTDFVLNQSLSTPRYIGWSQNSYLTFGYIKDTNFTSSSSTYAKLKFNSTNAYEIFPSDGTELISYICEAQVPCQTADNVCRNGGSCFVNSGRAVCKCPPGFVGTLCEEQIDNCESVPCLHGGTCNNLVNNFTCDCTIYYEGRICEKAINYKFENARKFVLSLSVSVVGLILLLLCLMDLPWEEMMKKIKSKIDNKKKLRALEEQKRKEKEALELEKANNEASNKVKHSDLMASEQMMMRRFKLALIQTKQSRMRQFSANNNNMTVNDSFISNHQQQQYNGGSQSRLVSSGSSGTQSMESQLSLNTNDSRDKKKERSFKKDLPEISN